MENTVKNPIDIIIIYHNQVFIYFTFSSKTILWYQVTFLLVAKKNYMLQTVIAKI